MKEKKQPTYINNAESWRKLIISSFFKKQINNHHNQLTSNSS